MKMEIINEMDAPVINIVQIAFTTEINIEINGNLLCTKNINIIYIIKIFII